MKRVSILFVSLICAAIVALGAAAPKDEVRALWVVRHSVTTPEKVTNLVRRAKESGFNTLFVQVRGRADAYYKSDLEPPGDNIADGFDPLEAIIREAKKEGLAVHAWLNTMYVWSAPEPPASPKHILNAHPDWLATDENGQRPTKAGATEGAFLCPTNPDARKHLLTVVRDLVTRYDLDGIHLDYIRYPDAGYCHCERCVAAFKEAGGGGDTEWRTWRRGQIDSLVKAIRAALGDKPDRPLLTAAVWANLDIALNRKGQDWPHWCAEGWLDAVLPMDYVTDETLFLDQAKAAVEKAGKTPVWLGIGAWRLKPHEVAKRIESVRGLGTPGFSLFSYGGITNEGTSDEYLTALRSGIAGASP